MSGIGVIVAEPNTASAPTNLLAQSWVPEPKLRRIPSCANSDAAPLRASELNAVGLPVYVPTASMPCRSMIARSRSVISPNAVSQPMGSKPPSAVRRSGWFSRSGSWWISTPANPLLQA